MTKVSPEIIAQLAPTGILRAALNMSNFLLIVGETDDGEPAGPSPDMARAIAKELGVAVKFFPFKTPAEISDSAGEDVWDIGNIGAEPQRAARMDFTAAYAEIESTYLVPPGSPIQSIEEVDVVGNRISAPAGSAYGLWLENNIKNADLKLVGFKETYKQFIDEKMEAFAGLRPALITMVDKLPGSRILDGKFASVQQAVGVNKGKPEALAWLREFVENAKSNGFVADSIKTHGVEGRLSVAPLE